MKALAKDIYPPLLFLFIVMAGVYLCVPSARSSPAAPQLSPVFPTPSVSWHAAGELTGQVGDILTIDLPSEISNSDETIDGRFRVYISNFGCAHILNKTDEIYPRLALLSIGVSTDTLVPGFAAHGTGDGWSAGWGGAIRVDGDNATTINVRLTGDASDSTIYTLAYQLSGFAERQ